MPGSTVPVLRQPFQAGDFLPYWAYTEFDGDKLFVPDEDPGEEHNLVGDAREKALLDELGDALREIDAPDDQFVRLGLA
jgi:hypothetical protein